MSQKLSIARQGWNQSYCPGRVVIQQQDHTLYERPALNDLSGDEELALTEVFFGDGAE